MKSRLLVKHDYLTLTVEHDGLRISATLSRYKTKFSASGNLDAVDRQTMNSIANALVRKIDSFRSAAGGTVGEHMEALEARVKSMAALAELASV